MKKTKHISLKYYFLSLIYILRVTPLFTFQMFFFFISAPNVYNHKFQIEKERRKRKTPVSTHFGIFSLVIKQFRVHKENVMHMKFVLL